MEHIKSYHIFLKKKLIWIFNKNNEYYKNVKQKINIFKLYTGIFSLPSYHSLAIFWFSKKIKNFGNDGAVVPG